MLDAEVLDTQRIAVDRFWRYARQGMLIAIALHLVFGIAGWLAGAMPLLTLQVATIAIYAVSYVASLRGYRWLPIALTWLDLLGHATFASWIVGVDSGFQFYSWILLPLLLANVHRSASSKLVIGMALIAGYVLMDWWLRRSTPWVTMDPIALAALRYFNIGCFLTALGVIAAAHAATVDATAERLNALASTDTLTGLLNRRRMAERLRRQRQEARKARSDWSILLLDVDHFKSINDDYGHARGDSVIVAVGEVLRANVRADDVVARWGGEEFMVLMPQTTLAVAREVAERIRRAVQECVVRDDASAQAVTVTIGIAQWQSDEPVDETILRADAALYAGKHLGRDQVCAEARVGQARFATARRAVG